MGSPMGYRFQPRDEEVITLLNKKKLDHDFSVQTMNEVDIYKFEPFDLPSLSAIQSNELVWYFFCATYKYGNYKRARRRTNTGYWKVTGKGCKIFAKGSRDMIGSKKFLVFCEHGNATQKHKTEWVMHEFRSQYNPPNKKDFVICRIERKSNNKPKISTGDDHQSSQHLASNFKNHIAEKNFSRVETQQLPGHLHMTYDFRNHVAENSFMMVEPQQLPNLPSRNHVAEKTVQGVEHEELADMTSNCRNHVAENVFSLDESQLPNQHVVSNSRNHAAEKIFPEVEYQQPNQYLTSDYRNHVAENIFPRDESQLLASHHLASQPINHVAENTYPWVEYQTLTSQHLISDFRDQVAEHSSSWVEPLLPAQFDALYLCNGLNDNTLPALQSPINVEDMELTGSNGLDPNSFSALQSPIYPEQISPSYSDGFSNDFNVMNFQFDSKQEDMNSQLAFQDKYPPEETGQTLPPCFNSSKSITEVHLGDGSDTDIETVNGWVIGYSPIAAADYYFDNIWEPQLNYAGEYYY